MQKRISITLFVILYGLTLTAQSNSTGDKSRKKETDQNSRFVGKYEMEQGVIHFTLHKETFILIVPGAPLQELKPVENNKFISAVDKDMNVVFVEDSGRVTGVIVEEQRGTFKGKKVSDDQVKILSIAMDSLLVLRKSTEHFLFLYSAMDSVTVDTIAIDMEKNYKRILNDFKLEKIPNITLRIYPDLKSFHKGINFPDAADQLLATAFGKDDIRMVSPNNAGPESWMLAHLAPHEFTHIVHLNIDYSPNNPTWLWEGVAQYEAGWFFDPKEFEIIRKKEFPRLADLTNGMEYMLGFVIIEAIKDIWGFDAVINLIKKRGDTLAVLEVSQKQFEEKIYEHIYNKYIQK